MDYSVNFWGSHPDLGNDDCWTGEDFETFEDAMKVYVAPVEDTSSEYVQLTGPNKEIVRKNPDFVKSDVNNDDWLAEIRREAGMLFGLQGLNDYS